MPSEVAAAAWVQGHFAYKAVNNNEEQGVCYLALNNKETLHIFLIVLCCIALYANCPCLLVLHMQPPAPSIRQPPSALRWKLQHAACLAARSSLGSLDPGSGREIPVICHDAGVWHGVPPQNPSSGNPPFLPPAGGDASQESLHINSSCTSHNDQR